MKFVRENLFLIVVAGIVLLGGGGMLAAYFKVSGDVAKAIDDRTSMAKTLAGLEGRGANAGMEEAAQKRIEAIRAAAQTVKDMCVEWNRRHMQVLKLVVPDSGLTVPAFPYNEQLYRDEGLGYVFTKTYVGAMQEQLGSLRPTSPPTDGEIQSQQLQWQNRMIQWKMMEAGKSPTTPAGPRPEMEVVDSDLYGGGMLSPLPTPDTSGIYGPTVMPMPPAGLDPSVQAEAMEKGRETAMMLKARRGAVYLDPCAMDLVFTEASPNPTVVGMWQAQLNLWVTSDIVAAINATNEEAFAKAARQNQPQDVLTAAVKRLARIDINENYVLPTVEQTAAPLTVSSYADEEYEVDESRFLGTATGVRDAASVLTGRGSCPEYDVLHYTFTVVMASRYLPTLERHLLSRNYHTILSLQIRPADSAVSAVGSPGYTAAPTGNYYYGPEPVVQVEIQGEVLLLTDWERGTWDEQTNAWSEQLPPLVPGEVLQQQYNRESPALRTEDVQRIPQEAEAPAGLL